VPPNSAARSTPWSRTNVPLLTLVVVAAGLSLSLCALGPPAQQRLEALVRKCARASGVVLLALAVVTFVACGCVALLVHEPVPVIHDEFSYLLMSNTFASGRIAMPPPPHPEFFETFHVIVHPTYASKYFPGQGLFLAAGELLTGHPIVGVWLSAALACAATAWMLQAWVGRAAGLLGGGLMVLQVGVFSYWTQTYWGGMVPALGGALFFGAARRLCRAVTWQSSWWLALGMVLVGVTRPVEGALVVIPFSLLILARLAKRPSRRPLRRLAPLLVTIPAVLVPAASAILAYNATITGSAWISPYQLHERQYQEAPQFTALPKRAPIHYANDVLKKFYSGTEVALYESQRTISGILSGAVTKLRAWWQFYCGLVLTLPLVLPLLLRAGWIRYLQTAVGLVLIVAVIHGVGRTPTGGTIVIAAVAAQIAILWIVTTDVWGRVAIGTSIGLIVFELTLVKWFQPHYFAPATSLIVYLQTRGLLVLWRPTSPREGSDSRLGPIVTWARNVVICVPVMCAVLVTADVAGRARGNRSGDRIGAQAFVLERDEWGRQRSEIRKRLAQGPGSHLIFVRYDPDHNPLVEWVFNDADLLRSKVIWARDLGTARNRLLIELFADRQIWMLHADATPARLAIYAEARDSLSCASHRHVDVFASGGS
jgi:hypothetical protein